MNNQKNTETQTQPQADVEKELDLFDDVVDPLEYAQTDAEYVRTLLNECCNDLLYVITFDGSKEDEDRKQNLLNRRPVLESFIQIALEYVIRIQDTLLQSVNDLYTYMKHEKKR